MKDKKSTPFGMQVLALAVASTLTAAPWVAEAASLGKITVLSALGQPLRAEIELSATRDELAGMTAQLAARDAARQAGVEPQPVVSDLRFAIEKRGGNPVVRVSSAKPINEPFLDFFLELSWPAGRVVREYVFLLDPPETATKVSVQPVRTVETRPPKLAAEVPPAPTASAPVPQAEKQPAPTPVASKPAVDRREVKRGENLRKIAEETLPAGVSLEQMLVGLYRSNPDAFLGGNMNRLRAGVVLNIPDANEAATVSREEARQVLKTQVADWNAYRQKLAATVAKTAQADAAEPVQSVSGKVTAKVEEKRPAAEAGKDKVKVSRDESAGGKETRTASDEALVAKEKALRDANERLALLEKNLADMQKLLELKNRNLAEAEKQALAAEKAALARQKEEAAAAEKSASNPEPKSEPKLEVKPESKPEPASVAKPEAVKSEEKPAENAAVPAATPVAAAPVAPENKPAEMPAPKKPKMPPPEPEPEEGLLDNPLLLAGGAGLLALLGGLFAYRRRRAQAAVTGNASTVPMEPSEGPNSVFRNTGGQSVDTGNTTPPSTDFSQTGPGTIDTDEVDPVAEADVYMAYGRDAQAEEILLEALQKDPARIAIHVKLLEIYANRKSSRQFETLASELYAQTGGSGPEWEKVVALGARLDPANPLYQQGESPVAAPDFDAEATMVVSSPASMNATLTMPGEMAQMAAAAENQIDTAGLAATEAAPVGLDFDLAMPDSPSAVQEAPVAETAAALDFDFSPPPQVASVAEDKFAEQEPAALDFDLGFDVAEAKPETARLDEPVQTTAALDIDFALPGEPVPEAEAFDLPQESMTKTVVLPEPEAEAEGASGLEFDVDMAPEALAAPIDLGGINLDLSSPAAEPAPLAPVESAAADPRWDEVNTKLDLAKAYEEMGDLEGTRELLQEVIAEGPADLVAQARLIMERIGG